MVAAVSLATPVFMLFMSLASIFGIGGTSFISRSFGAGENKYAQYVSAFLFLEFTNSRRHTFFINYNIC